MKNKNPLAEGNFIGFPTVVAVAIGINEAIFLNQLHYWTLRSDNKRDGFIWVYKTIEEWVQEFPFWSDRTIKRIKKDLEKAGLLVTANYNKMKMDRTLWYRIDYERLYDALGQVGTMEGDNLSLSLGQNDTMEEDNLSQPITIDYTETTTNNKNTMLSKLDCAYPFDEIVSYLNSKCGTKFKSNTKGTQSLIKARYKEGYELDDFKRVIDIKTAEWLNTDMQKYLRPPTLFGSKFEGYLNQPATIIAPSEYIPPKVLTIKADTGPNYD